MARIDASEIKLSDVPAATAGSSFTRCSFPGTCCIPGNLLETLASAGSSSYIHLMARKSDPFKKTPEEKRAEAEQGLAEYRSREAAVNKNMERLRALRLAHEAANPPAEKPVPATRAKKKVVR